MAELHPTFALPGDWWRIDLTEGSASAAASVKRYVERHAGRADDRAQYRAARRGHLQTAISEASRRR